MLLCKCFAFVHLLCLWRVVFVFIFFLLCCCLMYVLLSLSVRLTYVCERVSACDFLLLLAFYCSGGKEKKRCCIACTMDETEDLLFVPLFVVFSFLYSDFECFFFVFVADQSLWIS